MNGSAEKPPPISQEEEVRLAKLAKAGNRSAERELIEALLPAALKYARLAAVKKGAKTP